MADKTLKSKAIKVKGGKEYVQVADRVKYFNDEVKGNIETEIVATHTGKNGLVYVVKATATTPEGRKFTGHSQAEMKTTGANFEAALENAETSAVGRALGFMGIGVIDSIASADELTKAGVNLSPKATKSSETNESIGVCRICQAEGKISAKSGVAYCPNFKSADHQGQFGTIVNATSRRDDDFINELPID